MIDSNASEHREQEMEQKTERESAKRSRSSPPPLHEPFVSDYRPYSGKQLQAALKRRGNEENHKLQWDMYYRNNTTNGYKDRHYILREFHELREAIEHAQIEYHQKKEDKPLVTHVLYRESNTNKCCCNGNDKREYTREYLEESLETQPSQLKDLRTFTWLEAGCGVGNAFLPIFEEFGALPQWHHMLGFDISSEAIELLQSKQRALPPILASKMKVIVLDPTNERICNSSLFVEHCNLADASSEYHNGDTHLESVEHKEYMHKTEPEQLLRTPHWHTVESENIIFVSLIFVLCSMPVDTHRLVLTRIRECMTHPNSVLFFRDYAVDDHAAVRFTRRKSYVDHTPMSETSLDDAREDVAASHSYTFRRSNGTLSHFFSEDEVRSLFTSVGFASRELMTVERNVVNRKTSALLHRRFIQGRFVLQ